MSGLSEVLRSYHVEPCGHQGFTMDAGEVVRFTDLQGQQPIDFWAFNREDMSEYMSAAHSRRSVCRLMLRAGEAAVTNNRRPIMTILEDNSPGQHDFEVPSCDPTMYTAYGAPGHKNCQDNLHLALADLGVGAALTPQPWNLFTNFEVQPDKRIEIKACDTKPGDNIILRAEMDVYVAISGCPMDIAGNETCAGAPTDVLAEVGR